jgi:hypothetical protein
VSLQLVVTIMDNLITVMLRDQVPSQEDILHTATPELKRLTNAALMASADIRLNIHLKIRLK